MRLRLGSRSGSSGATTRRGLGDLTKNVLIALGINKPCSGCDKRAEKLNWFSGKKSK